MKCDSDFRRTRSGERTRWGRSWVVLVLEVSEKLWDDAATVFRHSYFCFEHVNVETEISYSFDDFFSM